MLISNRTPVIGDKVIFFGEEVKIVNKDYTGTILLDGNKIGIVVLVKTEESLNSSTKKKFLVADDKRVYIVPFEYIAGVIHK